MHMNGLTTTHWWVKAMPCCLFVLPSSIFRQNHFVSDFTAREVFLDNKFCLIVLQGSKIRQRQYQFILGGSKIRQRQYQFILGGSKIWGVVQLDMTTLIRWFEIESVQKKVRVHMWVKTRSSFLTSTRLSMWKVSNDQAKKIQQSISLVLVGKEKFFKRRLCTYW